MALKQKTKTTAAVVESGTPNGRISSEPVDREQLLGLVNLLIRRIGIRLEEEDGLKELHALAGDLMKLLALQKEIGPEQIEEVTVRWIGCGEETPVEG